MITRKKRLRNSKIIKRKKQHVEYIKCYLREVNNHVNRMINEANKFETIEYGFIYKRGQWINPKENTIIKGQISVN